MVPSDRGNSQGERRSVSIRTRSDNCGPDLLAGWALRKGRPSAFEPPAGILLVRLGQKPVPAALPRL